MPAPSNSPAITAAVARARLAWPGLRLSEESLAARFEALGAALGQADIEGLSLAQACLDGLPGAAEEFERSLMSEVGATLRRFGATRDEIDEVSQRVRLSLFLPIDRSRSKLEYYSGRGSLRGWFRAVVAQELSDHRRRNKVLDANATLADLFFSAATAPDVVWARAEARQALRLALVEAIDALPERERIALKLNALDGLSIDDLARLFQTHRSTAARWLQRARSSIEQHVRERLATRFGVSSGSLDSVVRLALEAEPITMERLLMPRE